MVVVDLFLVFMDLAVVVIAGCPMIVAPGFGPWLVFVLWFGVVDRRFVILIVLAPMAEIGRAHV